MTFGKRTIESLLPACDDTANRAVCHHRIWQQPGSSAYVKVYSQSLFIHIYYIKYYKVLTYKILTIVKDLLFITGNDLI